MDTDTQHAAVEGILRDDRQCCRCEQWTPRDLLHGTVDPMLLPDGRLGGMVCVGCMCRVYPEWWEIYGKSMRGRRQ